MSHLGLFWQQNATFVRLTGPICHFDEDTGLLFSPHYTFYLIKSLKMVSSRLHCVLVMQILQSVLNSIIGRQNICAKEARNTANVSYPQISELLAQTQCAGMQLTVGDVKKEICAKPSCLVSCTSLYKQYHN